MLRQAQHEACRRCGGFLVRGVVRCLGQSLRSRTRVPITSLTTPAHPEHCGDAVHQLCDHAQQRRQRELTKRRACKAMCVRSRRCHGGENTLGGGPRGKRGVQIFVVSHKSRGQRLEIVGEDFSVSDSCDHPRLSSRPERSGEPGSIGRLSCWRNRSRIALRASGLTRCGWVGEGAGQAPGGPVRTRCRVLRFRWVRLWLLRPTAASGPRT